jgi:predicted CxxxxCH...CXXCH cytochrome family protein
MKPCAASLRTVRPTRPTLATGRPWMLAAVAMAGVSLGACAAERPRAGAPCATWQDDIGPLVAEHCAGCHGGDAPAGSYDLTDYGGALGPGSDDVSNAGAGDAGAELLRRVDPDTADGIHRAVSHTHEALRGWVVSCDVAYFRSPLHPGGILDPGSADFHGAALASSGWDFALCASCHGQDFTGGAAGVPCTDCHAEGPTACSTCHRDVPASGAHAAHAGLGPLGRAWTCDECHVTPARWDAPGHLPGVLGHLDDDPPGAEVVFGAFARRSLSGAPLEPRYEPASGRCTDVFCHGGSFGDAAATRVDPVWAAGQGQADCGACHGLPPASHAPGSAADGCEGCHPMEPAQHIDGALVIGRSPDCSGCHGSAASSAPPRDLAGNEATSALGVGAHRSHLQAPRGLRGPVPCTDCHDVPAEVDSPGHIDSAAPAEVEAALGWDRDQARCSTSWCHGQSAPSWTAVGQDQAVCGACHGVPPADANHEPGMNLTSCSGCHPRTVDAFGNILRTGSPGAEHSEHIDGSPDLSSTL